jgi:transposase InsO family protein
VTHDDALFRFRLRVFAVAEELGNVRAACRMFGVHPSTFYRWRGQVLRYGLEILRPRERRPPRMPNATPVFVEQRVIAFALGHPGFGPDRIAAELARPKWGGIRLSPNGVWRVLCRHGLNTRGKRLALVAGYAAVSEPVPAPIPERHIEAARPGEVVQMDCFYVGRLQGTKGAVWQYTAIDVASAYLWATLQPGSVKHPLSKHASGLARQVAADLARHGWQLETVTTDRGSEFVNSNFDDTLNDLGARHRLIVAGRPQSNGCVERVQQTILDECWKPAFARHLIPGITGLREELRRYLHYYNHDRAHTGRNTKGRTPAVVLGAAKMWRR